MKRIITLYVLACSLMLTTNVAAWDEPVAPSRPAFEGTWVTPATGGQYYIYNVGASQFMGTGLDWGTRTITTVDSVVLVSQKQVAVALDRNYVVPFSVEESDTEGFVFIRTLNTNKGTGAYVTAEGNASWSDGDLGRAGRWYIEEVSGAYVFHPNTDESLCLGVDAFGATTSYTWADAVADSHYSIEWKFIEATDENAEAIKAYATGAYQKFLADLVIYDARKDFLSFILEAEEVGVDVTAAGAVYTKADATIDEIEAAKEQLKTDVFNYRIVHSSEENPFDVTRYVLQNPDFSASCANGSTPPGWEVTVKGQNLGQQNRKDVNPNDPELFLDNFIEGWIPAPQTLGDGYIGQWVSGLPQGRYRLAMDAVACNQSADFDPTTITGVYLFAGNGTYNLHGEESVTGAPYDIQHYEWDFDFNADRLLMGLLVEGTNANWISADNFRLYAIGGVKEDPNVTVLRNAIAEANELISQLGGNNIEDPNRFNVNMAVAEKFQETVSDAEVALKGSAEAVKEAIEKLQQASAELQKSAEDYQAYQQVYTQAVATAFRLEEIGQWEDLQNSIYLWAEEIGKAFGEGTLTADGLEEAQGHVDQLIADFIGDGSKIAAGDDLTILVKNADFNQGQYGPNTDAAFNPSAGTIPGWTVTSGNVKELSGEWHNIEAYGQAFDFNQTIKNLPAGVYRVTVQGYVRVDGGENDMELYAGISTKQFMDITEQYSEVPLLADADGNTPGWPYDTAREDGLGYQPNSMQGAGVYFSTVNPATGNLFYLNNVNIVHTGGDLTIGVRSARTNNNALWIIWDNFTLTYLGTESLEAILSEIDMLAYELTRLFEDNYLTLDVREKSDRIFERIDKKEQLTTTDDALQLFNDIKSLIQTIKDEQPVYQEVSDVHEYYSAKVDEFSLASEEYIALLDEVGIKISNVEFQNIAEMNSYIQRIKDEWTVAVMKGAQAGDDVTAVINNPDFETLNDNFWSIIAQEEGGRVGDNQGYQANAIYENGDIKIEHFIESWRADNKPLNDGDVCQQLGGILPEGYYSLEADGFALLQAGTPDEGIQGVSLFAQIGSLAMTQAFSEEGGTTPQHYTLNFHADGVSPVVIGIRVRESNANWFVADNFRLTFLGKEAPDGVEDVRPAVTASAPAAIYSLDGRQIPAMQRGINLVRTADGRLHKVLVK